MKCTRKLYLYMPARYLEDVLFHDELRLAVPEACNDERELMASHTLPEAVRKQAERIGVICFSEDCRNSAMWGHYADRHRGVCLEFNFPYDDEENEKLGYGPHVINIEDIREGYMEQFLKDELGQPSAILMKVYYSPYLPDSAKTLFGYDKNTNKMRLRSFCVTKGQDWQYEREWRLFADRVRCKGHHDGQCFIKGLTPFISRIILGAKCPLKQSLVEAIANSDLREAPASPRHGAKVHVVEATLGHQYDRIDIDGDTKSPAPPWVFPLELTNEQYQELRKRRNAECPKAASLNAFILKILNL